MSAELNLEESIKVFIKTADDHLDQELAGNVDSELSKQLFEAAENLVAASDEMLEDDLKKELKELKRVLIPSESDIESAQVLAEIVYAIISASIMEFTKGFFSQLGKHSADKCFKVLEKWMDSEGEFMQKSKQLLKKKLGKNEEQVDIELVELNIQ
ncbi:unnamed protein product [Chironomus riparius]|uniref:Uncharacterized protein n=1 Tax=Chironomus riparius TaxID=315576 RepID=A0A9N9WZE5_9DIPT|nr:unnamed protein product [Chironomus riparius]